jgi:methylenetetrahydrofolate dehydrogenase (NAD+)
MNNNSSTSTNTTPSSPSKQPKLVSSTTTTPPTGIIDATIIAAPYRSAVKRRIDELISQGKIKNKPLLVGLLANGDVAARKYAEWTAKACEPDGIRFELRECEPNELENKLNEANSDPAVHGIMIYYPCFGAKPSFYGGNMDDYLRDSVAVEKDVEGLCMTYRRNLYRNVRVLPYLDGTPSPYKCLLPCTPLAIVKILDHIGVYDKSRSDENRLLGKTITVINRSEIVGRPVAAMLANDGADVYSVDIDSVYLMRRGSMIIPSKEFSTAEECCRKSDVVITGVPSKSYQLDVSWLKPQVVVINVSNFKNIDEQILLTKLPQATYVPLVGKVTVSMLERNLLRLVENFHLQGEDASKISVIEAGGRIVKKN